MITTLLLIAGFVLDIGLTKADSRRAQNAADAAVLAGVLKASQGTSSMIAESRRVATLNGFTTGGSTTVTVNQPPLSGSKVGDASSIEVVIDGVRNTGLSRIANQQSIPFSVRAVATAKPGSTIVGPCGLCIMDRSGITAFHGVHAVAVSNANIMVRSTSAGALTMNGGGSMSAQSLIAVRGTPNITGQATITPAITSNYADFDDPLANLPMPTLSQYHYTATPANGTTPAGCSGSYSSTITCSANSSTTYTFNNGTYNAISVSGNATANFVTGPSGDTASKITTLTGSGSTYTINMPGGYIGSVNVSGTGSVSGIGKTQEIGDVSVGGSVTFSPGTGTFTTIDVTSNGNVNLQPGYYLGSTSNTTAINEHGSGTVNLASGRYYFGGDFTLYGNTTTTGTNILLYFGCRTNGTLRNCNSNGGSGEAGSVFGLSGNSSTRFTGRTSADNTYSGFFLIYDRNNTSGLTVNGVNPINPTTSGTIYALRALVTMNGMQSVALPIKSAMVVGRITLNGTGDIKLNFDQTVNADVTISVPGQAGSILEE